MVEEVLTASVVGSLAFPVALGLQQRFLYAPLRITSDRRIAGPLLGLGSVFLSGCCASLAAIATLKAHRTITKSPNDEKTWLDELPTDWQNLIACGLGSALVFRILTGRYHSVLPSNIAKRGAFARVSIPARRNNAFSPSARERFHKIGKKHGCHTCGRKWRVNKFHRDHQPPTALAREGEKQVYYPQCAKCSAQQGGVVSQRTIQIVTHGTSLRLYHLWMPVPLAWFGLRYLYAKEPVAEHSSSDELTSRLESETIEKSRDEGEEFESGGNKIDINREVVTVNKNKFFEDQTNKAVQETLCDVRDAYESPRERNEIAAEIQSKSDIENLHFIIRIMAVAAVVIVWIFRTD
ncbi:uncharacterized protein LOC134195708 [Corticium candelabrum]|uniref:uncharacterized protein LOC134195708 n=1 Tax=Corticium candelabrum TaxID=121492 RepID=UPI002E2653D0|nr:uncharacterized protein LOC134195708 [Corticium candelabrum]